MEKSSPCHAKEKRSVAGLCPRTQGTPNILIRNQRFFLCGLGPEGSQENRAPKAIKKLGIVLHQKKKKQRLKRQGRKIGKKKKRKRISPRSLWLRFNLYDRFLKKRVCHAKHEHFSSTRAMHRSMAWGIEEIEEMHYPRRGYIIVPRTECRNFYGRSAAG